MLPSTWLKRLDTLFGEANCRIADTRASLDEALSALGGLLEALRPERRAVWWIGNGGSAAICQHLSQDALNKLGLRSFAFAEVPLLTCMTNDFGYEEVYRRPLATLSAPGDLLIATMLETMFLTRQGGPEPDELRR